MGDFATSNESIEKNIDKLTNFDAEIAIIGCLLWDNRSYEKIADFLSEDHFIDKNNQLIYKTIKGLLDKNILVSPITLKNYLSNEIIKTIKKKIPKLLNNSNLIKNASNIKEIKKNNLKNSI